MAAVLTWGVESRKGGKEGGYRVESTVMAVFPGELEMRMEDRRGLLVPKASRGRGREGISI